MNSAGSGGEVAPRQMHRCVTGSRVNLSDLESVIAGAAVGSNNDLETSSVSSTRSGGGKSNIIKITGGVSGKKDVKAAMKAALAEAGGYAADDGLGLDNLDLETDDDSDMGSEVNTPKLSSRGSLKHTHVPSHASEPLEGAGTTRRSYQESSAPPEGAGGYQTGQFVPPQVVEHKELAQPKREPLGPGMHRSITGSSLKLSELQDLVEKAGESEPGTPSRSGRTPRSVSGMSMGSRSSSIVQIVPGVKDIRSTLANALSDLHEQASQHPESIAEETGFSERQSLDRVTTPSMTAPSSQAFGSYRPRSIRRLMSEKSITMDREQHPDEPSDALEGTGVVVGRKYVEPKHGPQFKVSPRDFPRVVNGVPMMGSGEPLEEDKRSSVPPSPIRKSGVHRTISGSQMNLHELEAILEKAAVPKSERQSLDGKSSVGGLSQTTHRSVIGSGASKGRTGSVFGEEAAMEPTTTFGEKAKSFNSSDLQDLIRRASVSRTEPDSPRSVASSVHT